MAVVKLRERHVLAQVVFLVGVQLDISCASARLRHPQPLSASASAHAPATPFAGADPVSSGPARARRPHPRRRRLILARTPAPSAQRRPNAVLTDYGVRRNLQRSEASLEARTGSSPLPAASRRTAHHRQLASVGAGAVGRGREQRGGRRRGITR